VENISEATAQTIDEAIREEILEEIADLEVYARAGKAPPHCRGYRFKVNGNPLVSSDRFITGRSVLEMAGLIPAANYTLRVTIAGQRPQKVGLDERVDLRKPGIEKFKALPRDQTEGAPNASAV
jgi:hypothetical protein